MSPTSKKATSGYVKSILKSIGLPEAIIQNFMNAGIKHPRQIADLDLSEYEALGVTDPEHRKKINWVSQLMEKKFQESEAKTPSPDGSRKSKPLLPPPPSSSKHVNATMSPIVYKDTGQDDIEEEKKSDHSPPLPAGTACASPDSSVSKKNKNKNSTPKKETRHKIHQKPKMEKEIDSLVRDVDMSQQPQKQQPPETVDTNGAVASEPPRRSRRLATKTNGTSDQTKTNPKDQQQQPVFSSLTKLKTAKDNSNPNNDTVYSDSKKMKTMKTIESKASPTTTSSATDTTSAAKNISSKHGTNKIDKPDPAEKKESNKVGKEALSMAASTTVGESAPTKTTISETVHSKKKELAARKAEAKAPPPVPNPVPPAIATSETVKSSLNASSEKAAMTTTTNTSTKNISMKNDEKAKLPSRRKTIASKIPQSNLPVSTRTTKALSAILDSDNADQQPKAISSKSSGLVDNENRQTGKNASDHTKDSIFGLKKKMSKRQTLAGMEGSLDQRTPCDSVNNSSVTSLDAKSFLADGGSHLDGNKSDSKINSRSSTKNSRAKSMYASAPSLQHFGQSTQLQPPRSKRTSISTLASISRTNDSQVASLGASHGQTALSLSQSNSGLSSVSESTSPKVRSPDQECWSEMIEDLRDENNEEYETFEVKGTSNDDECYLDMRIRVVVRKRPLSKSERLKGGVDIIHPLGYRDYGKILVYQPKTSVDLTKGIKTETFAFDNTYGESSTNLEIYKGSVRHLIQNFFEGQKVTCFAYGATGSGKTFTMMGSTITGINAGNAVHDESNVGLYYLAVRDMFTMLRSPEFEKYDLQVSLFEIYGGKLFDLSTEKRKEVKCLEDSNGDMCIRGLDKYPVKSPEDVLEFIERGSANRSTGETSANADSSRSHAVLQISLIDSKSIRRKIIEKGRFSFIDLAGSERGADNDSSSRSTRQEGADINTSLLALKEVIRALATNEGHIKYRGSELTKVLKDSFDGENSRCCMISCISPDIGNVVNTLNTLRYADHVKRRDPTSGTLPPTCPKPIRKKSWFCKSTQQALSHDEEKVSDHSVPSTAMKVPKTELKTSSSSMRGLEAFKRLLDTHKKLALRQDKLALEELEFYQDIENISDLDDFEESFALFKNHIIHERRSFVSDLKKSLHEFRHSIQQTNNDGRMIAPLTSTFEESDDDNSIEDLRV